MINDLNIKSIAENIFSFGTGFCILDSKCNDSLISRLVHELSMFTDKIFIIDLTLDSFPKVPLEYDVIVAPSYNVIEFTENIKGHLISRLFSWDQLPNRSTLLINDDKSNNLSNDIMSLLVNKQDYNDVWLWDNDQHNFVTVRTKYHQHHNEDNISEYDYSRLNFGDILTNSLVKNRKVKIVYAGPVRDVFSYGLVNFQKGYSSLVSEIKNGANYFIFDDKNETLSSGRLYRLYRLIKKAEQIMPTHSFILLTSSCNLEEIVDSFPFDLSCLQIISISSFEFIATGNILKLLTTNSSFFNNTKYDYQPKGKKFVCFNRVPRFHRIKIATFLFENNLHDQGYLSLYDRENQLPDKYNDNNLPEDVRNTFDSFCKHIEPLMPLQLNCTDERENPVSIEPADLKYFTDSYFSIVNETYFYSSSQHEIGEMTSDSVFFSEKIFKPLMMRHPFVLVGRPHSLKYLRELGYKTFSPFINEEYDTELNDEKRMDLVCSEIKRLCSLTDDEWIDIYRNLESILEFNFNRLCRLRPVRSTPINPVKRFINPVIGYMLNK